MTYDELSAVVEKQAALIKKLEERITVLEAELKKYNNSNTPPSANKHLKPNNRGKNKNSKRKKGAKKGHQGSTRCQKPERKEVIDTDYCPHCGSTELHDKKIHKRAIEEIPEPVKPEVVE